MGEKNILLCADSETMKDPSLAGLAGESLESISWLAWETCAEPCRSRAVTKGGFDEAWIVSCDDMEPINVAAAIKRDGFCEKVFLVANGQNGSLASRAANAGIDGLWSESAFARHYAEAKARFSHTPSVAGASDFSGLRRNGGDFDSARCDASRSVQSCLRNDETAFAGGLKSADRPSAKASNDASLSSSAGESGGLPRDDSTASSAALRAEILPFLPEKAPIPCEAAAPLASAKRSYETQGAPVKEGAATMVAVVAGSGGCGKSTLAAVFALLASRCGLRTAVLDADLQFGDMDYLLGIQSPLRIEEAVEDPARLSVASKAAASPFLVAAPRKIEVSELVASEIASVAAALKRSFDVVVVNTGALWTDCHAGILEASDAVAFVMDKRPSSLRAMVHAVELCTRLGIATTGFTFVVNRYEKASLLTAVDVSCALRGAKAVELADGGRDVDELLGAGYPDELLESKSAFVEGAKGVLANMLPERRAEMLQAMQGATRKKRSLFGRGGAK